MVALLASTDTLQAEQKNNQALGRSTSDKFSSMLGLPPTLFSHPIRAGSTVFKSCVEIPAYLTRTCT